MVMAKAKERVMQPDWAKELPGAFQSGLERRQKAVGRRRKELKPEEVTRGHGDAVS